MEETYGARFTAELANELRAQKARRGLSNEELAERAGLHRNTVQRYMSGERDISMSVLLSLCQALGVKARDMFIRAEEVTDIAFESGVEEG